MSVYLDTSVLVALLTNDTLSTRAADFLRETKPSVVVSDFAAAEFASAIARRVGTGELTLDDARHVFSTLDAWLARATRRIEMTAADVTAAAAFLRRLDLTLRTPDALHIAIVERTGTTLMTFDTKMADSARILGTKLADA